VLDEGGHLEGVVSVADLLLHGPGHNALETARGIFARETSDRSAGHPHIATKPNPEFFIGARDFTADTEEGSDNAARTEANSVVHGGNNEYKEFPA